MGAVFFMLWPFFAAVIGAIIALICLMGICLLIIGITGMIMNKMYKKQTNMDRVASKPLFNSGAIILGVMLMLFPFGYVLYEIVSLLMKGS